MWTITLLKLYLFSLAVLCLTIARPTGENFKCLLRKRTGELAKRFDRAEHRVGTLPWAAGEESIGESYAGYIKIRSFDTSEGKGNAGLFYWFFPAQDQSAENPPLIIWLQGGPGSSSMIGLFNEMGPFRLGSNMTLFRRKHTWNKKYGMLFIDQPVGTGYSYVEPSHSNLKRDYGSFDELHKLAENFKTTNRAQAVLDIKVSYTRKTILNEECYKDGYVVDQKGVADDFLVFLHEFYQRYPEQKRRDLYIAGESYSGKYVPSIAQAIHSHNEFSRQRRAYDDLFPLVGIAVGNGLTDPVTQVKVHGQHAFQLGLISHSDAEFIDELAAQVVAHIKNNDFVSAKNTRIELFEYFKNVTGNLNLLDVRKTGQNEWSLMEKFMNMPQIKNAINVGERDYSARNQSVIEHLKEDIMKSTAHLFPVLIENYKVLLYQGNMDFRDGVSSNTEWLYSLDFKGAEKFRLMQRKIWHVNDHVSGYVVQYQNLTRVVVLQAGHMVPMDQPLVAYEMITRFIENGQF